MKHNEVYIIAENKKNHQYSDRDALPLKSKKLFIHVRMEVSGVLFLIFVGKYSKSIIPTIKTRTTIHIGV